MKMKPLQGCYYFHVINFCNPAHWGLKNRWAACASEPAQENGSSQTIHMYKPFVAWMIIFQAHIGCHDILILGISPIKWRQSRHDLSC